MDVEFFLFQATHVWALQRQEDEHLQDANTSISTRLDRYTDCISQLRACDTRKLSSVVVQVRWPSGWATNTVQLVCSHRHRVCSVQRRLQGDILREVVTLFRSSMEDSLHLDLDSVTEQASVDPVTSAQLVPIGQGAMTSRDLGSPRGAQDVESPVIPEMPQLINMMETIPAHSGSCNHRVLGTTDSNPAEADTSKRSRKDREQWFGPFLPATYPET